MKLNKVLMFIAFVSLIGIFGYLKAEQGDYSTMGFNSVDGYSLWRVNSSGHLIPGKDATLDLGVANYFVRAVRTGTITSSGTITGVGTISGALIAGTVVTSSSISVVGTTGVQVTTAATSGASLVIKGAVVTLSTQPTTVGQLWYQTSDNILYISTRVPAANVTYCATTGCYAALH